MIELIGLVWKVWHRRRGLALLSFILPFAGAVGLITSLPLLYRATATILVEREMLPESHLPSTVTSDLDAQQFVERYEIFGRTRLEPLIAEFGLYANLRDRTSPEGLVARMRRDISVESKAEAPRGHGSALAFRVGFLGTDSRTVMLVTHRLVEFFVQEAPEVKSSPIMVERLNTLQRINATLPRVAMLLVAGLTLSLGVSAAAVLVAERLDTSVRTVTELQGFSEVPVFSIGRIVTAADQRRERRQRWVATLGAALAVLLVFWTCRIVARGHEQLQSLLSGGPL